MLLVNDLKFAQVKHPFQILDFVYFATSPILYITNEETGPRLRLLGLLLETGKTSLSNMTATATRTAKKQEV